MTHDVKRRPRLTSQLRPGDATKLAPGEQPIFESYSDLERRHAREDKVARRANLIRRVILLAIVAAVVYVVIRYAR